MRPCLSLVVVLAAIGNASAQVEMAYDGPDIQLNSEAMDVDRDGMITFAEFERGLNVTLLPRVIDQLIERLDTDGDRRLTRSEIESSLPPGASEADVDEYAAFLAMPDDEQVDVALQNPDYGVNADDELRALFARADRNGDGVLDGQEIAAREASAGTPDGVAIERSHMSGIITGRESGEGLSARAFDRNGDSSVTKDEMVMAMSAAAIEALMRSGDSDGNGVLNDAEMEELVGQVGKTPREEQRVRTMLELKGDERIRYALDNGIVTQTGTGGGLDASFSKRDQNGDGVLTGAELDG